MRAAPLPTPLRYPSHASPALTDSCSSSFSRAMTCCLPSAGRGLSTTLVFGVAQTLLAFLRDLREPEDFRPVGMHRIAPCRMWEWYCQVVCRKWRCASRESECVAYSRRVDSEVTRVDTDKVCARDRELLESTRTLSTLVTSLTWHRRPRTSLGLPALFSGGCRRGAASAGTF